MRKVIISYRARRIFKMYGWIMHIPRTWTQGWIIPIIRIAGINIWSRIIPIRNKRWRLPPGKISIWRMYSLTSNGYLEKDGKLTRARMCSYPLRIIAPLPTKINRRICQLRLPKKKKSIRRDCMPVSLSVLARNWCWALLFRRSIIRRWLIRWAGNGLYGLG